MQAFKTILIPVDFTINTEVAVCKTLDMVGEDAVSVTLLYVYRSHLLNNWGVEENKTSDQEEIEAKLKQWQESIEEYAPATRVSYTIIRASSVQQAIIRKAYELKADLIVVGKQSNHYWLPFLNTVYPSQLAKNTACCVLTVKPGSLEHQLKNVVVAISETISDQKMNILFSLCKRNKVKIFLVALMDKEPAVQNNPASSLLKIYQSLKISVQCTIDYAVLNSRNSAKALLEFTIANNADMLLLYPDIEMSKGWLDTHISDVLSPESKVQVLTVNPTARIVKS